MSMRTANKEFEGNIDELKSWVDTSGCAPKEINRLLLKRFYKCVNGNMEEAKKVIKVNYAMRKKSPNIFIHRDPTDEDTKLTFEYSDMILLPGLTGQHYKVTLYRYRDTDPNKVNHENDTKAVIMFSDSRFVYSDLENVPDFVAEGEIQIFDMKALPIMLKEIHMINCPGSLNKMIAIVRPFISKKVFELIHFHCENLDELYRSVPIEMMPNEYGGTAGNLEDLRSKTMQRMLQQRIYLMDPNQWKISDDCTSNTSLT